MPESYRYLLVRLRMERDKLLGWAVLAKLSEDERKDCLALWAEVDDLLNRARQQP